ncbi:hypothetical protein M976_02874 [Buttiauxella ferragutiae ATCC 51602]|uniref:Holin n=1 Tax=Buttiauxella ferragutiae ATCC 51602 TaxID=1354252 RepID=A0ABX2W7A7_9ENTR|nr:hypothetical protein [Buttiauxella ferragutiae]OAT26713.1 hypothetical protein M976_02874 [Buttiauxella ferragutiae ATCC 51602]
MPFKPPEDEIAGYFLVAILTGLGVLSKIAHSILSGIPTSFWGAVCQIIISTFASALVLMLAVRFQWQITGTAAACGISAWSGVAVVTLFEKKLLARLGSKSMKD